jgi:hypothetical protein
MKTAIQDTIHKPVNRYGDFTLRLGQMHKPILTDTQKRDLLDISDLQADPEEDYLWEPDDDDDDDLFYTFDELYHSPYSR